MEIRKLVSTDWPDVREIYQCGISTDMATFEDSVPEWKNWDRSHLNFGRFVAIINGEISGWIALSAVSNRVAYKGVAEISLYVHQAHKGKGIVRSLINTVIKESEKNGIWTLCAAIFPENSISISLFTKMGFRKIGIRERIAMKNGVWKDNVIFERRSNLPKFN